MPDVVLDDYVQLLKQLLEHTPDIYFGPSAMVLAVKITIAALTVIQSEVVWGALEHVRYLLGHPCLETAPNPPPSFPIFASVIDGVIKQDGSELTNNLLFGLIGDTSNFPEDALSTIITTIRSLAALWPLQLVAWLPPILQRLPASVPMESRKKFMDEVER
jgi:transportin-3